MLHRDTKVHHCLQTTILRGGSGLVIGNPKLKPERLRADFDRLFRQWRSFLRPSKYVNDIHLFWNRLERWIGLLAQYLSLARVDRDHMIADGEKHFHDIMRTALRLGRSADQSDGPGV